MQDKLYGTIVLSGPVLFREAPSRRMGITDALHKLFNGIGGWSTYLAALVGLGTLTMSVIQTIKDTTPLRRWFQRMQMRAWLVEHSIVACKNLKVDADATKAEQDLLTLATDGSEKAFYDLEVEKLCGQWNAANQIVLDSPHLYPNLFASVAARAQRSDFEKLMGRDFPEPFPPSLEAALPVGEQEKRATRRQAFLDAHNRVSHQVQRSVDAFQICTSFRWKWHLQIASFVLSFSIAAIAMIVVSGFNLGIALFSAAIAGFLAPVARDLLAAVQSLRP